MVETSTQALKTAPHAFSGQRLQVLDALRGLALFGILMVNIVNIAGPLFTGQLDAQLWNTVRLLFMGKFYPIFAFLFGLGVQLQLNQDAAKPAPRARVTRRLWVLLAIGAAHAIFVWTGDILTTYALVGLIWLQLNRLPRWWGFILIAVAFAYATRLEFGLFYYNGISPTERVYIENFRVITEYRLSEWFYLLKFTILLVGEILMLFWLGSQVGRNLHLLKNRNLLGLTFAITLPLGLWLNQLQVSTNDFVPLVGWVLAAAYIAGFFLLGTYLRAPWLKALANAGRMPLSNYLGQSIISTLVFYGYGLGYYSQWSLSQAMAFAAGLYIAQLILSSLWLKYFQYGPAEWLWRSLTYGKILSIRKISAQPMLNPTTGD